MYKDPAAKVSAKGTVALVGEGQSDLSYLIDVADLSMFQTLTRHTLGGSAHAEGRITGPAGQLKTAGTLASNSLTAGPAKALALKSNFDVAIPVNDLERTTGQMDLSGSFVEVSGRRIDEVTGTLSYDGVRLDVDATLAERARTFRVAGALVPHPGPSRSSRAEPLRARRRCRVADAAGPGGRGAVRRRSSA